MGIPVYFQWLRFAYPKAIKSIKNRVIPNIGSSIGNYQNNHKNGVNCDNFYVDMNSIIHHSFHGDFLSKTPSNLKDVYANIFK